MKRVLSKVRCKLSHKRLEYHVAKATKLRLQKLRLNLEIIDLIDAPADDKELESLKNALTECDEIIEGLKERLSIYRVYVNESEE